MNAEAPKPRPSSTDGVFSLEDLDKIIDAEDPNFKNEMENIKSAPVENTSAIEDLQVSTDDDPEKEDESEKTKLKKILDFVLRPWRRFVDYSKLTKVALKNRIIVLVDMSKTFVRHELPERLRYLASQIRSGLVWIKKIAQQFWALPGGQKIALVFMSFASIFSLLLLSRTLTGAWLPGYVDDLPRNLEKNATVIGVAKRREDLQDLFQAFPEVEYHVLLKKAIVNLRRDDTSGPNPMGVFELYLGVDSQDTAIEVKHRELEILDIVQRAIENFSYTEVNSVVGKIRVKSAVRDRVNEILNQGRVFQVYYNTVVINH